MTTRLSAGKYSTAWGKEEEMVERLHFLQTSQPKVQTLREKIGRETSFGTTPYLARTSPLTSGVPSLIYLTRKHVLHKIFNRNTVKISYSCMPNLNKTSTATTSPFYTKRSCRQDLAIVEWKQNALWVETASRNRLSQFTKRPSPQKIITLPRPTCMGLTENSFKTRSSNHKSSFANANKRNNTELRKYIWYLKENLTKFKGTWRILKHASSYNPTSNKCNLCLWEKYFTFCKPDLASLNKRNELTSSCKHVNKYALENFRP